MRPLLVRLAQFFHEIGLFNAKLQIEKVPIVLACDDCGANFQISKLELSDAKCPECEDDDPDLRMISGREYTVLNLEVA